jgi:hypothetical protein
MSHQKEEYDHVPTPQWLLKMFEDYFDPYPLGGEKLEIAYYGLVKESELDAA